MLPLEGGASWQDQWPVLVAVGVSIGGFYKILRDFQESSKEAEAERQAEMARLSEGHEARMRDLALSHEAKMEGLVEGYREETRMNRELTERALTQMARSALILERMSVEAHASKSD